MSRPSDAERTEQESRLIKVTSSHVELCLAVDLLDSLLTKEVARFGSDSEIAIEMVGAWQHLAAARTAAATRAHR